MKRRLELDALLRSIAGNYKIYYQPPSGESIAYPCIVYSIDGMNSRHANNSKYFNKEVYKITVMDKRPNSSVTEAINELSNSKFVSHYSSGGLNHDIFTITMV